MPFDSEAPPAPPSETWAFVDDLARPTCDRVSWIPRPARADEADLAVGITLVPRFPDPEGLLDTAYANLKRFFADVGIRLGGPYRIVTEKIAPEAPESYVLDISSGVCRLGAGDPEGLRRAVYYLEDEILRAAGPFLRCATIRRRAVLATRLTRCCYGPKNRPPVRPDIAAQDPALRARLADDSAYRDELMDTVDYYPDAYLNRLARDGVNGLWITQAFWQLCRTATIPEYGQTAEQRLAKLRVLIARARRYGIRVFILAIEPRGFGDDYKTAPTAPLVRHPELAGHNHHFCTSTPAGLAYVEEAGHYLFSRAPGLGGLIDLCVGEMKTHCWSGWIHEEANRCPRCALRDPLDVLAEMLTALARGIHRADPHAEVIAWPYSQYLSWGEDLTRAFAGRVPPGVTLQHNFESGGRARQLGRLRRLDDYWLAYPGPSALFVDCAQAARAHGTKTAAKIQVGCSYELATVPFVPVPGNLYQKFKALHELGVQTVMECWLVGSFPSLMTRAAGDLSFAPLPETPEAFLMDVARRDWPGNAPTVAEALACFQRGYAHYPFSRAFSYYAPINNGPVWPLYLRPRDWGLSPPFKKDFPPSGDRIGECIMDDFTWEETLTLCRRMCTHALRGVALLKQIRPHYTGQPERMRDIGVATAVGILMRSCFNILQFYYLRDQWAYADNPASASALPAALRAIVAQELALDAELLPLTRADSRLGFQADAECHILFPARIEWRMAQLRALLNEEFPAVEQALERGESPFGAYTGATPEGPVYRCQRLEGAYAQCNGVALSRRGAWARPEATADSLPTLWRAQYDDQALTIEVTCHERDMESLRTAGKDQGLKRFWENDCVEVSIEPQRLWPVRRVVVTAAGARWHVTYERPQDYGWQARAQRFPDRWCVTLRLPWAWIRPAGRPERAERPFRMNVRRIKPIGKDAYQTMSWTNPVQPLPPRLMLGTDNPLALGWCICC